MVKLFYYFIVNTLVRKEDDGKVCSKSGQQQDEYKLLGGSIIEKKCSSRITWLFRRSLINLAEQN